MPSTFTDGRATRKTFGVVSCTDAHASEWLGQKAAPRFAKSGQFRRESRCGCGTQLSCREVYLAEPDEIGDDDLICDIAFPLGDETD
jgi:hypothetical protein